MLRFPFLISALLLLFLGNSWAHSSTSRSGTNVFPDLYEATVEELQNGMEAGHFTSVDLVKVGCPQILTNREVSSGIIKGIFFQDQ